MANPGEMVFIHDLVIDPLASIPQYVEECEAVFGPGDLDIDRVTDAIAAFEEILVTPNARFGPWLKGDRQTIAAQLRALQGQRLCCLS